MTSLCQSSILILIHSHQERHQEFLLFGYLTGERTHLLYQLIYVKNSDVEGYCWSNDSHAWHWCLRQTTAHAAQVLRLDDSTTVTYIHLITLEELFLSNVKSMILRSYFWCATSLSNYRAIPWKSDKWFMISLDQTSFRWLRVNLLSCLNDAFLLL